MIRLAGLAAAAAFALIALPASAQVKNISDLTEAQKNEMYCVHDKLGDVDTDELVAQHNLYTDLKKEDQAKAEKLVEDAVTSCASKYNWTQDAKDIAADIGVYGASIDYLSEDLYFDGVEDKQTDNVFKILDTLSNDDIQAFGTGSWTKNEAMKTRLNSQLRAAGVPNNADTLETGQYLLEASVLAAAASYDWISTVLK